MARRAFRPLLAIDFDGVIHSYERGWQDGTIYGDMTAGFWVWAERASMAFTLVVYSSRSKTLEGRQAMRQWMEFQWSKRCLQAGVQGVTLHDDDRLTVTEAGAETTGSGPRIEFQFAAEKPAAWLTIDDRCVRFDGNWDDPILSPDIMLGFKPWMIRGS